MTKIVTLGFLFAILAALTRPTSVSAMMHDRLDEYMMDPDLLEWDTWHYEKEKKKYDPFKLITGIYIDTEKLQGKLKKALEEYTYDVNATNADGDSILHKLFTSSNFAKNLVFFLMQRGANINLQDHNGDTPLHLASKRDDTRKVIIKLIESGADVSIINKDGKTALDLAIDKNHILVPYLILVTDFYAVMNNKMSFKKYAVKHLTNNESKWCGSVDLAKRFGSCGFIKKLCRPEYVPNGYIFTLSEIGEKGGKKKFYQDLLHTASDRYDKFYDVALAYDILVSWPTLLAEKLTKSKKEFPWSGHPELRDHVIRLIKTKQALMGAVWLGKKQVTEKLYVGDVCNYKRDIVKNENDMDETARIPLDVVNRIVRFIPYAEIGK